MVTSPQGCLVTVHWPHVQEHSQFSKHEYWTPPSHWLCFIKRLRVNHVFGLSIFAVLRTSSARSTPVLYLSVKDCPSLTSVLWRGKHRSTPIALSRKVSQRPQNETRCMLCHHGHQHHNCCTRCSAGYCQGRAKHLHDRCLGRGLQEAGHHAGQLDAQASINTNVLRMCSVV